MGSLWRLASDNVHFPISDGDVWHGLIEEQELRYFFLKIKNGVFNVFQMGANTLFGMYAGVPPILSPLNKWANGKKGGSRT